MLGQNCPSGEFLTGFDSIGNILCGAAPPGSTDPPPTGGSNDANAGEVIITEIMADPATTTDGEGEWFELFNLRSDAIDIRGWTIEDHSGNSYTIPTTESVQIPSNGFVVLGSNADTGTNGGISIDHQINGINLNNSGDTIIVFDVNGEEIDRVDYGLFSSLVTPGISLNLDPSAFNSIDNDSGSNWCLSNLAVSQTAGGTNSSCF